MSSFSMPVAKRPPVKVPELTPIEQAPPEKRQEYKELVKAMEEEDGTLEKKLEDEPSSSNAEVIEEVTTQLQIANVLLTLSADGRVLAADKLDPTDLDPAEPSEEDKQAFVRSLLGDKPFEKEFLVFGEIKIKFRDRSVAETEDMYKRLDKVTPKPASPEEWTIILERELAALTCISVDGNPVKGDEQATKLEAIMASRRGLYHAILECSRTFERMLEILVARSLDQGFWKAGGAA